MSTNCSYHQCKKHLKKALRCKYCNKAYCNDHIRPVPPSKPFGAEHSIWEKKGHPCPEYVEEHKIEVQKEEESIRIATKKLLDMDKYADRDEKSIKKEFSKEECSYHLCSERGVGNCQYCGKLYCIDHIKPTKPAAPYGKDHNEWAEEGHPCPDYVERHKQQVEEEDEQIRKATQAMISGSSERIEKPYIRWPENKCSFCNESHSYVLKKCWYCHKTYCNRHIRANNHNCSAKHISGKPLFGRHIDFPSISTSDNTRISEGGNKKWLYLSILLAIIVFASIIFFSGPSPKSNISTNPIITISPTEKLQTENIGTATISIHQIAKIQYLKIGELSADAMLPKIQTRLNEKFKLILQDFHVDDTHYRDFKSDYGGYLVQEYIYDILYNLTDFGITVKKPGYFSWLIIKYPNTRKFSLASRITENNGTTFYHVLHSDVGFEKHVINEESGGLYCGTDILVLFHYDSFVKEIVANSTEKSPLEDILKDLDQSCKSWMDESSGCIDANCGIADNGIVEVVGTPFSSSVGPVEPVEISGYYSSPKQINLKYVLRGAIGTGQFTVFGGINDYLASLPRIYTCYGPCPPRAEIDLKYVNEPTQKDGLDRIITEIGKITQNRDDQVRIAVSIVQNIPYDHQGVETNDLRNRYPYEVLFDETGVCGEKSKLLAYLLRGLGYGVVLFEYERENHEAVGIKCPSQYSHRGTGYCFIESTAPSIITDDQGDYIGAGKLTSQPMVIPVSDGASFESVAEEYSDNQVFIKLQSMGTVLDQYNYALWAQLVTKYGMITN